jgi:hypothetical protein
MISNGAMKNATYQSHAGAASQRGSATALRAFPLPDKGGYAALNFVQASLRSASHSGLAVANSILDKVSSSG